MSFSHITRHTAFVAARQVRTGLLHLRHFLKPRTRPPARIFDRRHPAHLRSYAISPERKEFIELAARLNEIIADLSLKKAFREPDIAANAAFLLPRANALRERLFDLPSPSDLPEITPELEKFNTYLTVLYNYVNDFSKELERVTYSAKQLQLRLADPDRLPPILGPVLVCAERVIRSPDASAWEKSELRKYQKMLAEAHTILDTLENAGRGKPIDWVTLFTGRRGDFQIPENSPVLANANFYLSPAWALFSRINELLIYTGPFAALLPGRLDRLRSMIHQPAVTN